MNQIKTIRMKAERQAQVPQEAEEDGRGVTLSSNASETSMISIVQLVVALGGCTTYFLLAK